MAKLDISFDTFKSQTSDLGSALLQGTGVFYIKTASHGRVELNALKGTVCVGAGAPVSMLDPFTAVIESKTKLRLSKRNKTYAIFSAAKVDISDFRSAFAAVTSIAMPVKTKKVSAPKFKKQNQKLVKELKVADAAAKINAIRAKNMETIKSVAAKRAAKLVG